MSGMRLDLTVVGALRITFLVLENICMNMHFKDIVLFSDSWTGQNRDIKTSLTLVKPVQDSSLSVETLNMKYMIPGHSFLPNDSEFGIVKRNSKQYEYINVSDD